MRVLIIPLLIIQISIVINWFLRLRGKQPFKWQTSQNIEPPKPSLKQHSITNVHAARRLLKDVTDSEF